MLFEHPKNRDLNGFDHDNMHGLWVFLVVQVDFMIHQQHENMDITSNSHTNYRGYSLLYPLLSIISHEYSMNIPLYIYPMTVEFSLHCHVSFISVDGHMAVLTTPGWRITLATPKRCVGPRLSGIRSLDIGWEIPALNGGFLEVF